MIEDVLAPPMDAAVAPDTALSVYADTMVPGRSRGATIPMNDISADAMRAACARILRVTLREWESTGAVHRA